MQVEGQRSIILRSSDWAKINKNRREKDKGSIRLANF